MVEIRTPRLAPAARPAEQVSTATATELGRLGGAMQNVADRYTAYYEEKAADNADLIWAQTQADWSRKFNETSPKAGEGYALSTLQDYDSYVDQVMPTVPMRQQENMQHMFAKYRINLESKALQAEAAARAKARAAQKAETQRLRGLAMLEDPTFANYKMLSDGLEDKDRLALLGVYAEATLKTEDRSLTESFRGLLEDTDTFDQLLNADQKLKLMENIDRVEAGFAREDAAEIDQMIADMTAHAANTGEARTDLVLEEIEFSALSDDEKAEARRVVEDSVTFAQDTYDIRGQSAVDTTAYLRDLRDNASTEADWRKVGIYEQARTAHNEALRKDQAGYVQSIGYGTKEEFEIAMGADTPDAQREAWKAYTWRMDDQYHKMGIPPSRRTYLPKGSAEGLVATFNESTTGLGGPQLQQYLNTWGETSGRIQQELIAAGLDDTVSAQLWRPYDPILNQMLASVKGADLSEVKAQFTSEETSAYNELEKDVYNYVEDYFTGFTAGRGAEAQDFMRDMARVAIDTIMVHKANGGTMDNEAILGRFFTEEVVVADRLAMIVPEGRDGAKINQQADWLLALRSREIADKIDPNIVSQMTGVEDGRVDREVMAAVLRSNGMFVLNNSGDGVRLGYNMGGQFVPFDVEYTFDELDAMSVKDLTFAPLDQPSVGGTIYAPSVGGGEAVVAPQGTVVLRQDIELEYSSDDPYYQEDLEAGNFRPGQAVLLDGQVVIPVPAK